MSGCTVSFDSLYSQPWSAGRVGVCSTSLRFCSLVDCGQIPLTTVSHRYCATLPPLGVTNGELVWDCEAVEEGTRPSATETIRIECGTGNFCRGLPRPKRNQSTREDFSQRTRPDRGRSESAMGKSQRAEEGRSNCEAQTNDVSVGSSQDCCGSTGEVGKGQVAEESCLT